jgi:hypothetical protein
LQEAKEAEVTLLDDDPDAAEAVLRHIYNFTLEPPADEESDKVRFYANVVVAADKYGVLTQATSSTPKPLKMSLLHSRSSPKNTATTNRSSSAQQVSSSAA